MSTVTRTLLALSLLFVLGETPIEQVIDESLLIGQERFAGQLEGGMEAWERAGLAPWVSAVPGENVD